MKTLILGDIHGRSIWKDVIEKEVPDRVIFLGDYVSTHEGIPAEEQLSNLSEILEYKEQNVDKVILLRGNHDMQHLGYYWAECSGYDMKVQQFMSNPEFLNKFLSLTQWIYIDDDLKTIFSHAGISKTWLNLVEKHIVTEIGSQYDDGTIDDEQVLRYINNITPCELFGFIPDNAYDFYGESKTQPPTWIRPNTLQKCNILGYDQVVGHTTRRGVSKISQSTKGKHIIWLCDALGSGSYLTINDKEFIINKI